MTFRDICIVVLILLSIISCTKESPIQSHKYEGRYLGTFHDVAACFGCVPSRDTMYSGSFEVTYIQDDSINISRSHDNYQWKFALSSDSVYTLSGYKWAEIFTFKSNNTLHYYYNRSGSGGYFNTTFEGIK